MWFYSRVRLLQVEGCPICLYCCLSQCLPCDISSCIRLPTDKSDSSSNSIPLAYFLWLFTAECMACRGVFEPSSPSQRYNHCLQQAKLEPRDLNYLLKTHSIDRLTTYFETCFQLGWYPQWGKIWSLTIKKRKLYLWSSNVQSYVTKSYS